MGIALELNEKEMLLSNGIEGLLSDAKIDAVLQSTRAPSTSNRP